MKQETFTDIEYSLDEGPYQDYFAGKLWICWTPDKPEQSKQPPPVMFLPM